MRMRLLRRNARKLMTVKGGISGRRSDRVISWPETGHAHCKRLPQRKHARRGAASRSARDHGSFSAGEKKRTSAGVLAVERAFLLGPEGCNTDRNSAVIARTRGKNEIEYRICRFLSGRDDHSVAGHRTTGCRDPSCGRGLDGCADPGPQGDLLRQRRFRRRCATPGGRVDGAAWLIHPATFLGRPPSWPQITCRFPAASYRFTAIRRCGEPSRKTGGDWSRTGSAMPPTGPAFVACMTMRVRWRWTCMWPGTLRPKLRRCTALSFPCPNTPATPLCNPVTAKGPPPVVQRAALSVPGGQAQCTTASCGRSRRVVATRSPMISPSIPAPILTVAPSSTSPDRIISASGSCSDRCITRFSGRAP